MDDIAFLKSVRQQVHENATSGPLVESAKQWHDESRRHRYQYLFTWLGRPIIQDPQDIVTVQEIIWQCKPDYVVETGIARGGSLMLSASVLAVLDYAQSVRKKRKVIGVDIDIREYNREKIVAHPLADYIELIQGSSIDERVVSEVKKRTSGLGRGLVLLDSYHTCDHVYGELLAYAPLVGIDSYCVVFDTGLEDVPIEDIGQREWGPGNSPKTAVDKFLKMQESGSVPYHFAIDEYFQNRSVITSARGGFLKRTR